MNALNYQDATMTTEEAESIVRRLAERSAHTEGPKVRELADALGVPPEEVARTLAEIRMAAKPTRRSSRRERRVWLLSGLVAMVLAATAYGSMEYLRIHRYDRTRVWSWTTGKGAARTIPSNRAFRVFVDGQDMGSTLQANLEDGGWHGLPESLESWLKEDPNRFGNATLANVDPTEARRATREGRWNDVGNLRMHTVELRRPSEHGNPMRWAVASVPIYTGDDALVAEAVGKERQRLMVAAIEEAMNGLEPTAGAVGVATAGGGT